jgi:Polyketide cyclase / dehydrase and lipid transport
VVRVSHTEVVDVPASAVWEVVGDFGNGEWLGYAFEVDGSGVGATRTVRITPDAAPIVERCAHLDDGSMVLRYSIVDGNMLPVTSYLGEVHVAAVDDEHCEFTWTTSYEPVGKGDDVRPILQNAVERGVKALKRLMEATPA